MPRKIRTMAYIGPLNNLKSPHTPDQYLEPRYLAAPIVSQWIHRHEAFISKLSGADPSIRVTFFRSFEEDEVVALEWRPMYEK
jgi:hypothetical protein